MINLDTAPPNLRQIDYPLAVLHWGLSVATLQTLDENKIKHYDPYDVLQLPALSIYYILLLLYKDY
jgi:hypothetical protein